MSAFAVTHNGQFNTPGNPGVLNLVMENLSHRGPDGMTVFKSEKISMGHWHFWTTPEEVGEQQPLHLKDFGLHLVFDGRIDNRADLFAALELDDCDHGISDAMLFLHSYARRGPDIFKMLVGEFAAVLYDENKDKVIAVRDPLGDRTLFYTVKDSQLIIASEPWAIAHSLNEKIEVNEAAVAYFFANKTSSNNETYFKGVYELLPAQLLIMQGSAMHTETYWQPDFSRIRFRDDDEYAEHFLRLLEKSVLCRMRATGTVGVMMSGGLDSTSVTALAARSIAPQMLKTISFTFPSIPESDEKSFIDAMRQKWNLDSLQIPCDDVWTFKDWPAWKPNPNHPGGGVHYHMLQRIYESAKQHDLRVLLTGAGGDPLYYAGREWLGDLLLEGKIGESAKQLFFLAKNYGFKYFATRPYFRLSIRRVMEHFLPFFRNRFHKTERNDLLTDYSHSLIDSESSLDDRHTMVMGPSFAFSISRDAFTASRHGVEMRNPYRDRRLVEYTLRIPAHQFFRNGVYKHVLRNAMQGLLPEMIRTRKYATSILPLYLRGFKEEKWLAAEIDRIVGGLRKFINPAVVLNSIENPASSLNILSAWQCLSYDKWHHSLT